MLLTEFPDLALKALIPLAIFEASPSIRKCPKRLVASRIDSLHDLHVEQAMTNEGESANSIAEIKSSDGSLLLIEILLSSFFEEQTATIRFSN